MSRRAPGGLLPPAAASDDDAGNGSRFRRRALAASSLLAAHACAIHGRCGDSAFVNVEPAPRPLAATAVAAPPASTASVDAAQHLLRGTAAAQGEARPSSVGLRWVPICAASVALWSSKRRWAHRSDAKRRAGLRSAIACSADEGSDAGAPVAEDDSGWKVDLLLSVAEECQTEPDLRKLVSKKPNFILYDGFEPSGRMHIAQGVFKTVNVNKCTKAGGTFIFWVADWFALMNDKMGGDIDKIKTVGRYLIEVWKASGMDMTRVKFLWSSEEISKRADEYWGHALDIAQRSTLARIKKCGQIMGRKEDQLSAAQILYPIMQCADIFFLNADICQLGVDQRKVNMLARDYCDSSGRKLKPVILSHHMLYGLKKGQAKMSKSDPDSAIFMEDSREDVSRKLQGAYCPSQPDEDASKMDDEDMHLTKDKLKNPCLDYIRYVLFSQEGFSFDVGGATFTTFEALQEAFVAGDISEEALKEALIAEVNVLLEPVRQHFQTNEEAKSLLEQVAAWRRETLEPAKSFTRLSLPQENGAARFIVFAPLPGASVQMQDIFDVMRRLKMAPEGCQPVLWLPDWSARAQGCLGGKADCIAAFYSMLLHGLRALAPGVMEGVDVRWQGEAILSGPEAYWTSVINAGRQCNLEEIRGALPPGAEMDGAGQVVSSIMHVGDVLALAGEPGPASVLCCTAEYENLHALAVKHFEKQGLEAPQVTVVDPMELALQEVTEGNEANRHLLLTDKDPDVNRKIKKSFCEPQNLDFCPPLSVVEHMLLPLRGELIVSRKSENGGDSSYTSIDAMREDFASGVLHPGDLKPAVGRAVNALLSDVRDGLKKGDMKQAQKKLETFAKQQQKLKTAK